MDETTIAVPIRRWILRGFEAIAPDAQRLARKTEGCQRGLLHVEVEDYGLKIDRTHPMKTAEMIVDSA